MKGFVCLRRMLRVAELERRLMEKTEECKRYERSSQGAAFLPEMPHLEPLGSGNAGRVGSEDARDSESSSTRGTADHGSRGREETGPRRTATERDRVSKVLLQASKIIKTKLHAGPDIVIFLDNQTKLMRAIEDIYGEESERTKIQIALNQMDDKLRSDADVLYDKCRQEEFYDLDAFCRGLLKMSFPAPRSSLDIGFQSLRQNYPEKSTIVEYGRRFRTMARLLDKNPDHYFTKFVAGLASGDLQAALRRTRLEGMDFDELVALAVSIGNMLLMERPVGKEIVGKELVAKEVEGQEECYKIMGVPLAKYFAVAEEKNVNKRCFNCFSPGHQILECRVRSCKFCDKLTSAVKHFSLLCPLAPKTFDKYLGARDAASKNYKKAAPVRYAEDFEDYLFDSDEFSD